MAKATKDDRNLIAACYKSVRGNTTLYIPMTEDAAERGVFVDLEPGENYTKPTDAIERALELWPHATFDIDSAVAAYEAKERAAIPGKVKAKRESLQLEQDIRQYAAREKMSLAKAEVALKAERKEAKVKAKAKADAKAKRDAAKADAEVLGS